MKVLMISPAGKAGTIQYTHNLANALAKLSHQVILATGMDFELRDFHRDYQAFEIFDRFRPRPIKLIKFFLAVKKFDPDIIHLQGAQHPGVYLLLCLLLRLVTKAPFVYTPQDVLPNNKGQFHLQAFRLLYRQISHVFLNASNNEQDIVKLFGVAASKISVLTIPDLLAFLSTDLEPELPDIPKQKKVILCFGLIEPRKGIHTLLQAMPLISEQISEILLLIVGKPLEDIAPYEEQISTLNMSNNITLVPRYVSFNEMAGFFNRADIIVLPYHTGWNSGVVSSAFGFKKPVIATTIGGFKDVIEHGKTGLLVPPKDPDSLADAIVSLARDDQQRKTLVENATNVSKKNSWNEIAKKTSEIYIAVTSSLSTS
jgi:glycosyltransferase involved in cell wall biosynthesis